MRHLAVLVALAGLAGCLRNDYTCHSDSDCNLGEGGRCELDHRCTEYDSSCPLQRRYVHAAGADLGACFDDAVAPRNPCASGQPPAPAGASDACAAAVCGALPACCTTGWSETCVQQAEISCDVRCDTRIAITAEKNLEPSASAAFALYDLRLDSAGARYRRVDNLPGTDARAGFLAWLAPPPGGTEPRLASLDATQMNLVVTDEAASSADTIAVPPDRTFTDVASVDFGRDGHDVAVLAAHGVNDGHPLRTVDLATHDQRGLAAVGQLPLAVWGDWDADPFPDALAASGNSQAYDLLHDVDSGDRAHVRVLDEPWASSTGTPTGVALVGFSWADLDGDGALDAIAWGSELRVHFANDDRPPNTPRVRIDCSPLAVNPPDGCATGSTNVSVVGTARAGSGAPIVLSIADGTRNLYEIAFSGHTPKLPAGPLWSETCTPSCPPIRAVIARDVDGDHQLDLIAITADLAVYVRLATGAVSMVLPPQDMTQYPVVRVSVSGAPE